jgi:hypothetical protein
MMQWWEKLVRYFYNRALNEQLKERKANTAITNLADAKTVGILYDSTNPSNDIIITKFAEQLRNSGKQVEILAYINDPKIESKADITLFNKKAVSWLPKLSTCCCVALPKRTCRWNLSALLQKPNGGWGPTAATKPIVTIL